MIHWVLRESGSAFLIWHTYVLQYLMNSLKKQSKSQRLDFYVCFIFNGVNIK